MGLVEFRKFYRVTAASVASYDRVAETWGTPVAIPNLQGIQIAPMTDNDEARIYGAHEEALSVMTGMELTLDFLSIHRASANVMTGNTSTSSGSGSSEERLTRHRGGRDLPYFGLIVAVEADDGGDVHLLLPKVKLSSLIGMQMSDENAFVTPNITARALRLREADNTLYDVYGENEHATATGIAEDFNTAFAPLEIS